MVAVRRLAVLAFAGVLAACLAAPAGARPAGSYPETVTTDHFQIHFTGDDPEHATYQQAADLAASAERAYAKIVTELGYPAPLDDGEEIGIVLSGSLDVHVGDASYRLDAGDSIRFSSTVPHWFVNPGPDPVDAIWVSTPPSW